MPDTESIGGVSVIIGGDYSPLVAAFGQAQGAAAAAGQRVAAAFTAGAGAATGLVDQFGRSIGSLGAATAAAEAPAMSMREAVDSLSTTIAQQSSALSLSIQRNQAFSESADGAGEAARGMGAALRPFIFIEFGRLIFEAAKNALGLADALKEVASSAKQADSAMSQMVSGIDNDNVKRIGEQFGAAAGEMEKARVLGAQAQDQLAAIRSKLTQEQGVLADSTKAQDIFGVTSAKVQALENDIDGLNAKYRELSDASNLAFESANRTGARQAGQQSATRTSNAQSDAERNAEIERALAEQGIEERRAVAEAAVKASIDSSNAAIANAQIEVQAAKEKKASFDSIAGVIRDTTILNIQARAVAESQGQDAVKSAQIQLKAQEEILRARDAFAAEVLATQGEIDAATNKLNVAQTAPAAKIANDAWTALVETLRKAGDAIKDYQQKQDETAARVAEITAKGQGQSNALGIDQQRLLLERQYGLELVHTRAQELTYAQQLASFGERERQAKLDGLKAELQAAEVVDQTARDEQKIAQLKAEIGVLSAQNANADITANTKILDLIQQQSTAEQAKKSLAGFVQEGKNLNGGNVAQDIVNAVEKIPQALGTALSNGIFGGHKQGEDVGKQVTQALAGIGKQLVGDVLTQGIQKIVSAIVVQTGLQAVLNALFPTVQTAQTLAITAAITASTSALILAIYTSALIPKPLGFAGGGTPPVGVPSVVGERGPELFVPHESGVIVPNHALKGYADGAGNFSSVLSSSSTNNGGDTFHFHLGGHPNGQQVVDHVMRELPRRLKTRSSSLSPYST